MIIEIFLSSHDRQIVKGVIMTLDIVNFASYNKVTNELTKVVILFVKPL